MKKTHEEKKQEAIKRMKAIGIIEQVIDDFDTNGLVNISEPPLGAYYWPDEDIVKVMKQFEKEYKAVIYSGIRCFTNFGELYSFLYVSDYPGEWKQDRSDLKDNKCVAYVYNKDVPEYSEIGSIGFQLTPAAGLKRTW